MVVEVAQERIVDRIKSDLESFVGVRLKFRANVGRRKIVEKAGIIEETHPNLFVVRVEEKRELSRLISYNYADVLTGTVELTHLDSGENLLPWLIGE